MLEPSRGLMKGVEKGVEEGQEGVEQGVEHSRPHMVAMPAGATSSCNTIQLL